MTHPKPTPESASGGADPPTEGPPPADSSDEQLRRGCGRVVTLLAERRGWDLSHLEQGDQRAALDWLAPFAASSGAATVSADSRELWPLLIAIALLEFDGGAEFAGLGSGRPADGAIRLVARLRQPETVAGVAEALSGLLDQLIEAFPPSRQELAERLLQGQTVPGVARQCGVSERTVASTRSAMLDQLRRVWADE